MDVESSGLIDNQAPMETNNGNGNVPIDSKAEEEEKLHFQKVINAFKFYKRHSINAIHKREEYLNRLPMDHQKLLRKHGYQNNLDDLKEAVETNVKIVNHILADVSEIFENVFQPGNDEATDPRIRPTPFDMDKVQSTIKQIGEFTCADIAN